MRRFTLLVMACLFASMTFASGNFSVSANRQVVFAPGNLQWHPKDSLWRIAPSQLDWCGNANLEIGNPDYDGWVDLLEWSLGEANNFGATSNYDTLTYCNKSFVDWGNLFPGEHWFTLSSAEWGYLLNQRPGWNDKWGMAIIGDTLGMILLPDEWTAPEGVDFVPGTLPTSELWGDDDMIDDTYDHYRVKKDSMPANKFTVAEWQKLEDSGALFIPYAGRRSGGYGNYLNTNCETVGSMFRYSYYENYVGTYWTRTLHNAAKGQADYVYTFYYHKSGDDEFYDWGIKFARWSENGRYGQSVRLAKAVPNVGDTIVNQVDSKDMYFKITSINPREVKLIPHNNWSAAFIGALNIPDSVEDYFGKKYAVAEIAADAVRSQSQITSVKLPKDVRRIESYAFQSCGISSITFPASIEYIATMTFSSSTNLAEVYFEGTDNLRQIIRDAFSWTPLLENATDGWIIVDSVAIDYKGATPELLAVPDNVAFVADLNSRADNGYSHDWSATTGVRLGRKVKAISLGAFMECENATYLSTLAPVPPEVSYSATKPFNGREDQMRLKLSCSLTDAELTAYNEAEYWGNRFEGIDTVLVWNVKLTQTANGTIAEVSTENCNEVKVQATADDGYKFVNWSDGSTENPHTFVITADTDISAVFDVATAIDSVTDTPSSVTHKFLKDGQLYILRNGKVVNVLGQSVR